MFDAHAGLVAQVAHAWDANSNSILDSFHFCNRAEMVEVHFS